MAEPFYIIHNDNNLKKSLVLLEHCQVKPKDVMEYTEKYYEPIDNALHNAGILVSAVNAILVLNTQKNKSAPSLLPTA